MTWWKRSRSWIGLAVALMCTCLAGFLSLVSAPRYFAICASSTALAVAAAGVSVSVALVETRIVLRLCAVAIAGIALLMVPDAFRRAVGSWDDEREIRFACRMATDCGSIEFVPGPSDGYVSACGRLFRVYRLGIAVDLRRGGKIVGGGFVGPDGYMTDDHATCAYELWNRAVDAQRRR